jgi:hypothetical protein
VLAGTDLFRVEVVMWRGLVTYNVLFFVHLETRRVSIAGITDQPSGELDAADGEECNVGRRRLVE